MLGSDQTPRFGQKERLALRCVAACTRFTTASRRHSAERGDGGMPTDRKSGFDFLGSAFTQQTLDVLGSRDRTCRSQPCQGMSLLRHPN